MGVVRGTVKTTGTITPVKQISISPEVSGLVVSVGKDSTEKVKKGDVLAQIDKTKFLQQLDAANAALTNAEARLKEAAATATEAESKYGRYKNAYDRSGGKTPSLLELDQYKAASERANAAKSAAEQSVKEAFALRAVRQTELDKTTIVSPIDGIVLKRSVEPGNTVQVSLQTTEIFVIAENLDNMKIVAGISEADIGKVKVGQEVAFTVGAYSGKEYRAKVTKIETASKESNNVVTYDAEIEVPNADREFPLHSGMTADVQILVGDPRSDAFVVPVAALRYDPSASADSSKSTPFYKKIFGAPPRRPNSAAPEKKVSTWRTDSARIWTLDAQKRPVPIPVTLGLDDGKVVEINSADPKLRLGIPVLLPAE
ncbi:MAG: efflux RND transporter periplasmic adaptor subunit [Puniceicoccales bacterium]|nr:efflux RND transporter periplasmic adaptor subunit [Puniceicoccales bacterium]